MEEKAQIFIFFHLSSFYYFINIWFLYSRHQKNAKLAFLSVDAWSLPERGLRGSGEVRDAFGCTLFCTPLFLLKEGWGEIFAFGCTFVCVRTCTRSARTYKHTFYVHMRTFCAHTYAFYVCLAFSPSPLNPPLVKRIALTLGTSYQLCIFFACAVFTHYFYKVP